MPKFDQIIRSLTALDTQLASVMLDVVRYTKKAREYCYDRALLCLDLEKNHIDQIVAYCAPQSLQEWLDEGFSPLVVLRGNRKQLSTNIRKGMTKAEYVKFGDTWQPKSEPKAKKEVRFMASADANKARTPSEEVEQLKAANRELRSTERAAALELENLRRVVQQGGYELPADLVAENKRLKAENKSLLQENTRLQKALDKVERQLSNLTSAVSKGRRKAQ